MKEAKYKRKYVTITSVHPWDDFRVFHKEIVSISQKFALIYYAQTDFKEKYFKNIKLIGLKTWAKKTDRIKNYPFLIKIFYRHRKDVLHIHDPELLPLALFASFFGAKIIWDMHEDFLKDFSEKIYIPKIVRIFMYRILKMLVAWAQRRFEYLIIAEDHYMNGIKEKYGNKCHVIHNFPNLENLKKYIFKPDPEEKLIIGYTGGISYERGLKEMLHINKYLDDHHILCELRLVGISKIPNLNKILEEEAKKLKRNKIQYYGYMEYYEGLKITASYDIAFSLIHPLKNYLHSYPTKIFEYMYLKKPILVYDLPISKRVKKDLPPSYPFILTNFDNYLESFLEIYNNLEEYKKAAEAGLHIVEKNYHWDLEKKKLLNLYTELSEC